jgi:hypothetical protein
MMDKEPPEPDNPIGTVVIGTLDPDLMTTAKEMVRKALKRAQFKTIDSFVECCYEKPSNGSFCHGS